MKEWYVSFMSDKKSIFIKEKSNENFTIVHYDFNILDVKHFDLIYNKVKQAVDNHNSIIHLLCTT